MNIIANKTSRLLQIPTRVQNVTFWYLLSLMLPSPKHSLTFAASLSGLCKSQFSRFLGKSLDLAVDCLKTLGRKMAKELAISREILVKGTPWSIAIVIDATLQHRSSRHPHNSKKFNHGQGFVVGHQWTNIILIINGEIIPLSPIAFYSKKECKRRQIDYKTEHQRVVTYITELELDFYIGAHNPSEVVVLLDSGYDNKLIQRAVLDKNWDFVSSLRKSRNVQTPAQRIRAKTEYNRVDDTFWSQRKHSPWKTVRTLVNGWKKKMRKEFRARELIGYLKGIGNTVKLVCSEERGNRKGTKYLACSNQKVSLGAIVRAYRYRWLVELFHKDVKSNLGFQHVSVHEFNSVAAHVHWVYCSYLLLRKFFPNHTSLSERQMILQGEHEKYRTRKLFSYRQDSMDSRTLKPFVAR